MNKQITHEVLVFLIRIKKQRQEVALAYNLQGQHEGLWVGYRLPISPNEKPEHGALRALAEKGGIAAEIKHMRRQAVVEHREEDGRPFLKLHVLTCRHWMGRPKRTLAMGNPMWFSFQNVPYENMANEEQRYLPHVLVGEKIMCSLTFDKDRTQILDCSIQPTSI